MPTDPIQHLTERFAAAISAAYPGVAADPSITASKNPKFGDFQCNAAMALSKLVGRPPREVAVAIVRHADVSAIAEPLTEASIAGPGFINITLRTDALSDLVVRLDDASCGIAPATPALKIVVDLCGVNLAKQMHVGHLRSIIIGDCVARTIERLGHTAIRQNHVGDWGLPIAMVTGKLMRLQGAGQDITRLDLDAIEKLYRSAQKDCNADERGLASVRRFNLGPKAEAELEEQVFGAREALAAAKQTLIQLQSHDPATVGVWQRIADVTMTECLAVCKRLGAVVTAADSAGESSYAGELAGVVEDLVARGVAVESDGALVIHLESPADGGIEEPCLVRKSDGGFLYATTDLAAIRRRVRTFGADRVVYCVDARQGLHFKQVFAAARKAGYATRDGALAPSSLEHAAFGMVLGDDGRPFKTRSGDNVKLADLLDEAVQRAMDAVGAKSPDLSPEARRGVAEAVGIAAIKYADLSTDRVKDYVFQFDRMLAFEGNTGPYLLYAAARISNIFAKAEKTGVVFDRAAPVRVVATEEKQLALAILRYPGVVAAVGQSAEPHRLCQYLADLAGAYTGFYTNCHVLNAPDEPTRQSRLRLCAITLRILNDGLALLGIRTLERM